MIVVPFVPLRKVTRIEERRKTVVTEITQYVVFNITIKARYAYDFMTDRENEANIYTKTSKRYIPEERYAFYAESVVYGDNCKPLRGEKLYEKAYEQNEYKIEKFINGTIKEYRKRNSLSDEEIVDYELERYESLSLERKYETKEVKNYVPVYEKR